MCSLPVVSSRNIYRYVDDNTLWKIVFTNTLSRTITHLYYVLDNVELRIRRNNETRDRVGV